MELRQLQFVVAVAEHLHFGRAADSLGVGQPAVSQQVRRLERELGVGLFDRSGRTVVLSEAGHRFVPAARDVLAAVDRARESVRGSSRRVLRVGTSSGLGEHLTRVLAALARFAPEVTVELRSASTRARIDDVRAGRLDAAFLRGTALPPDLEAVPVWDDPVLVALPAAHPLIGADPGDREPDGRTAVGPDATELDPVGLASLRDLPLRLVSRSVNPPLVDLVIGACTAAGFEPRRAATAGRLEDTLAMLAVGEPSWAVVYAAHAASLRLDGVAFRATSPALAMPTSLIMSPASGSAALAPLIAACRPDG